ncbi:MAG: hypothetical protein CME70_11625 [Halobacteriovorax sp.]|nr:hypothetical protein [Halobacteriovorax sp.]|tara:strand:+ start:33603 stop:33890 length:288 start_codon:yes stop_codon:yes gene_type:complete
MKKLLLIAGLLTGLNAAAFTTPDMPSVDWDQLERTAHNIATKKAQNFVGGTNVKVRKVSESGLTTNYLAVSGQCTFTVKVGFAFRSSISNVNNCK